MIEVFTSHWRSPLLRDVDAQIVGVSRGTPRWSVGYRYRNLPELAPNDATWSQEDEEAFERSYLDQLASLGAERIVADLERIGGGRPVVCLCWEKPGEWCHRRLLSDYIERETGIMVPELRPGDLPQREDVAELRLF